MLKKYIILVYCTLLVLPGFSQQVEQAGNRIDIPSHSTNYFGQNDLRSTSCIADTLHYLESKATGANPISINNSTSASGFCQYFDCPSQVTLEGVEFIAYKPNTVNGSSIDVRAYVYLAGEDSLPDGNFLTTGKVSVDTNQYGFDLDKLTKTIVFDSTVTIKQNYVITVMNNSSSSVNMYSSDFNANDGQGEYLGSAKIGADWVRTYNISVSGNLLDADMLFYPIVSYELDADFSHTPNCNNNASTDTLTNLSSGILFNRFYSLAAANGVSENQCLWDYGDGTASEFTINSIHGYAAGTYDITLTTTMMGWTTNCIDTEIKSTCDQTNSVESQNELSFNVYPNPAQNFVNINSSEKINLLEIYDMNGRLVQADKPNSASQYQMEFPEIPNGLYIMTAETVDGQHVHSRLHINR